MRSVGHFIGYNLKRLFASPRPYIVFLIIFGVLQFGFGGCRAYLSETGQKIQAVELFLFAMNSNVFLIFFTLGFLLLLGDAPFLKPGMSFRFIRTTRAQWLIGQILSCVLIVVIDLLATALLFLIFFAGSVTFQNKWSLPITIAAQTGSGMAIKIEMAILFPMNILKKGLPYSMFGLSFLSDVLLYTFFSMVLIVCNLRFRAAVGNSMVIAFVGLKLMLNYLMNSKLLWYVSPCNLANIGEQLSSRINIAYATMFFFAACLGLGLLALHFTERTDLLREDYA